MENNILQIIPLADRPAQYGNDVIALALVQQSNGEKHLVYIAHDPGSGRPVLQNVTLTQPQNYFLEDDI